MKSASEEHSLLLAAGEFADVSVFETTESELLEKFSHAFTFGFGGSRSVPLGRGSHQDDFANRDWEVPVDRFDLGNVGNPQIGPAPHFTLGGPEISEHQA
jgi:hypothetical protein